MFSFFSLSLFVSFNNLLNLHKIVPILFSTSVLFLQLVIPFTLNPLNAELNPICYLLALLAHHFLHVSRIRVKSLTLSLLMSYIYIYIWSTHS